MYILPIKNLNFLNKRLKINSQYIQGMLNLHIIESIKY